MMYLILYKKKKKKKKKKNLSSALKFLLSLITSKEDYTWDHNLLLIS
jgi:hypothetical protein